MKKRVFMILCAVSLLINGVILTVNAMTTTVRVGYCSYMAPYQYADTSGQPQGFHIDVLEAVAEKAGLLTEFVSFNTTSEALNALQSGDIDIVIGVPQNQFANHNIRYTDVIAQANILCIF